MKAQKNAKVSKANTVKASETAKAVSYSLNLRNAHNVRQAAESLGVDLFAVHSQKQVSREYIATLAAHAKSAKAFAGKGNAWLCIAGIANRVELREGGFYARLSGNSTVHGNTVVLAQLYGKAVRVLSDAELAKLADGAEVGKYVIGSRGSRRELSGFVADESGDCFALAVKQDNGTLALVNGEWSANARNAHVRASLVKG